jgi:peptidoglycan/LPS O-acetylase OafA/YrhL
MAGTKKEYFEPLDGLRALAAIFILFFHSHIACFEVLWIGVPLFFALSGFLITRILVLNKNSQNYFKVFYFKRALRIFPIYYLLLAFCIVWGKLVSADLSQLPYYLFYLQSFIIEREFCHGLMQHTWSLSVEELFYLFWPFFLFIFPKKSLLYLSVVLGSFSICYKLINLFFFYSQNVEGKALLSLFGNLDSLMAGAILALLFVNSSSKLKRADRLFYPVSLLFLIICGLNYYYSYTIVKIGTNCAVAFFSFFLLNKLTSQRAENFLLIKIFSYPALVFIGTISYGLYLYHVPIYSFVDSIIYHYKFSINPIFILGIKLGLTFIISILSWYIVEKPLLRFKNRMNYKPIIKE